MGAICFTGQHEVPTWKQAHRDAVEEGEGGLGGVA